MAMTTGTFRVPRKPVPSQPPRKKNTLGLQLQMATVRPKLGCKSGDFMKIEMVSTPVSPPPSPSHQTLPIATAEVPVTPQISEAPTSPPILGTRSCMGLGLVVRDEIAIPPRKRPVPPLTPLLQAKEVCSLCNDAGMIRLNATELECGHFVHGFCYRKAWKSLEGDSPICLHCGKDCSVKLKPSAQNVRESSCEPKTAASSIYEELCEEVLNISVDPTPDVEALKVYSYVHYNSPTSAELMLQVKCQEKLSNANTNWRYTRSALETKQAKELVSGASWGAQLPKAAAEISASSLELRLYGKFETVGGYSAGSKVEAFLFPRYLLINYIDSIDKYHSCYDLDQDDLTIYVERRNLVIKQNNSEAKFLASSKSQLAMWITAINDQKVRYPPIDTLEPNKLGMPGNLGLVDRGTIEQVLCLPIAHLNVVPFVLSQLGPQDRLGLVIVTNDGSTAYLDLHKPSWPDWSLISSQQIQYFDLFTPAYHSVVDTAQNLFKSPFSRPGLLSQSIVVVAGCPLTTSETVSSIVTHAVGFGKYDLTMMTRLTEKSDGRFYHADSEAELLSCVVGLSASERTVMHSDVEIVYATSANSKITQILGHKNTNCEGAVNRIGLGRMISGQTRTVLIQLSTTEQMNASPMLDLCDIRSKSAANGNKFCQSCVAIPSSGPKESSSIPLPLYFDRIAKITSELLKDCQLLAANQQWSMFRTLLDRAASSVLQSSLNQPAYNPVNTLFDNWDAEIIKSKPRYLAKGLKELKQRLSRSIEIDQSGLAVLYEARQVLETQCAVTSRSSIDRLFFEELIMNRL